jgi:hypothetical protein
MLFHRHSEHVQGVDQDCGVLEKDRRWQNRIAQSPSKGEFKFEGGDVMLRSQVKKAINLIK